MPALQRSGQPFGRLGQLAGAGSSIRRVNLGSLCAAEHNPAGSDIRLAQPSRAEPGDRQVRHGDVQHGRRPRLHSPCRAGRIRLRRQRPRHACCAERGQRRPRDGRRLLRPGEGQNAFFPLGDVGDVGAEASAVRRALRAHRGSASRPACGRRRWPGAVERGRPTLGLAAPPPGSGVERGEPDEIRVLRAIGTPNDERGRVHHGAPSSLAPRSSRRARRVRIRGVRSSTSCASRRQTLSASKNQARDSSLHSSATHASRPSR